MRGLVLGGIALAIVGGFLLLEGGSIVTRRDVLKIGDLQVTAEESHPVKPWVAGAMIVGGVVLLVSGLRRKT
jgi:hypothetical protein